MLRSSILSAMVLGLLSGVSSAADPTKLPAGPAPTFLVIVGINKEAETFEVYEVVPSTQTVEVKEKFIEAGIEKSRTVLKELSIYKTGRVTQSLKGAEFFNVKGAKLKDEEGRKRFLPGSIVLVSSDGKKVDPRYLHLVKDDTLILVIPLPR